MSMKFSSVPVQNNEVNVYKSLPLASRNRHISTAIASEYNEDVKAQLVGASSSSSHNVEKYEMEKKLDKSDYDDVEENRLARLKKLSEITQTNQLELIKKRMEDVKFVEFAYTAGDRLTTIAERLHGASCSSNVSGDTSLSSDRSCVSDSAKEIMRVITENISDLERLLNLRST